MKNELEAQQPKKFPWDAFAIYTVILIGSLIFSFWTMNLQAEIEGFSPDLGIGPLVVGLLSGIIGSFIAIGFQYLVIKLFSEWGSKQKNIYKNEMLSALLYSSTVGIVLNSVAGYFNYQGSVFISSIISIVVASLFIYVYISGQEKEVSVKKAVSIVRIVLLVISISFTVVGNLLINNFIDNLV